jgi:hypothetical protein
MNIRITSNFTSIFITLERIVKIKTIAIVTATDNVSPDSGWEDRRKCPVGSTLGNSSSDAAISSILGSA